MTDSMINKRDIDQTIEDMIDHILPHYLHAAVWSSNDPDTEEPLDDKYHADDFTKASVEKARGEIKRFINIVGVMQIDKAIKIEEYGRNIGYDLWFTQVGHGVGFWDGDWPEPFKDDLTEAAGMLGELWVWPAGNNQHLHLEG